MYGLNKYSNNNNNNNNNKFGNIYVLQVLVSGWMSPQDSAH